METLYNGFSCPVVNLILYFALWIRPKWPCHILPNSSLLFNTFSPYPRNLSSIWIPCQQSYVYISSSFLAAYWCRSICVHQASDLLEQSAFTSVLKEWTSSSYAIIVSGSMVPTTTSIFLESARSPFEKCGTSNWNDTFSCTSYISGAGSTLNVDLSVRVRSREISPLQVATTIAGYSFDLGLLAARCLKRFKALSIDTRRPGWQISACLKQMSVFPEDWYDFRMYPHENFCVWGIFLWSRIPCMLCRVECLLLSFRLRRNMWVPVGFPSGSSTEWLLVHWSILP